MPQLVVAEYHYLKKLFHLKEISIPNLKASSKNYTSFRSFRPMPHTASTSINVDEIWVDLHMKNSLTETIETDLTKSLCTAFDRSSLV